MGNFGSAIPLDDNHKSLIIQAISDGNKKEVLDFMAEYDLETYNGIHFLKWDFANTNLLRNLSDDRFQCLKIKRGPWKLVLVYDKETKYLYSLMNKHRFLQLQERVNKEQVHYIDALALINKGLRGNGKNKQLRLFIVKSDKTNTKNLLKEILQQIDGEVIRFTVIAFSNEKDEITSVSALVPTPDLEVAYQENWNEFIAADYNISLAIEDNGNQDEDDEIKIVLRKEVAPNHNDKVVQLKKVKREGNKAK